MADTHSIQSRKEERFAGCWIAVSDTRVADSAALTDGVNVTPTVQVAPEAMLVPQVFEPEAIAKSVAGAAGEIGTTVMLVKVTVVELLLVTVTVCGAVATPIACVPKLIKVGAR